jgi:transposase-like protein
MKPKSYSKEFKDNALRKARERSELPLKDIADSLNLPLGTFKYWIKQANKENALIGAVSMPPDLASKSWSAAQRLQALHESHALQGQELHAWCREKGLFEHQLRQWRSEFCQSAKVKSPADAQLRQARQKVDQLERELRRKDKALAEAAALLVLQKKFQALWEAEEL